MLTQVLTTTLGERGHGGNTGQEQEHDQVWRSLQTGCGRL
jgi:hypothetical protein